MKEIKVGVEKMPRNRRKMIQKTEDSLLCPLNSIQFSALFLLLSEEILEMFYYLVGLILQNNSISVEYGR